MNTDDPIYNAQPNSNPLNKVNRRKLPANLLQTSTNNDADDNDDNDQYSLTSSISQSSYNSRADNSLIFERLVQDPLTSAHPHSLPRHISSETFIPASLDTKTHMIKNNDFDFVLEEPIEFGFNSRRSSLANLEAALGPPSRRTSSANLQSFRSTLSRSNTNSSFSNLTQQLQNANNQPQSQPLMSSHSQSSVNSLPPLTSVVSSSSIKSQQISPGLKNKSFCSYADIIAQDDQDANFAIRRPSISTTFSSQQILARTNSISSINANSPRSPSNISAPFANNFRANSISNVTRLRNGNNSPITNSCAIDDDAQLDMKKAFLNRPLGNGCSMRASTSHNTIIAPSNNNTIDDVIKKTNETSIKKSEISPQCSRDSQ